MPPDKIGRYEIKSELGHGGMATVYHAYDPEFGRDVAVKVLPPEFMPDATYRARFKREAKIIASLEHPAIVPVYDYGEAEEQPYIVMRFMPGGSLADRLKKGPLTFAEAVRIIGQLAPALDAAHEKGIYHRDLKPANILFDQHKLPYVADFGIAKLAESTVSLTGTGVVGTPAYMSPEQARGEREIDGRADVYALGAILFEMLTGNTPYKADTPVGLVMKHISEPVPRIVDVKPGLPQGCQAVINGAMAKERDQRYSTARLLAEALEAAASDHSQRMRGPAAAPPTDKTVIEGPSAPGEPAYASRPSPPPYTPPRPPPAPRAAPSGGRAPPPTYVVERPRGGIPGWVWALAGIAVLGAGVLVGLLAVVGPMIFPELLPFVGLATDTPAATSAPAITATSPAATGGAPTATPAAATPAGVAATPTACVHSFALRSLDPAQGTSISADRAFTLTFQFLNSGPCFWPNGMILTLERGDQLGATPVVDVPPVGPGQLASIEIGLRSPGAAGSVSQTWELRLPDGSVVGDPIVISYQIVEPTTATPTARPTVAPVTAGPTSPPTVPSAGGPIVVRRTMFVSAARTSGNDAVATLSVEFTGGTGPFTITGDGIAAPQVKGITGTFTDAGVTYSYIHFDRLTSCGASLPGTANMRDAAGQVVTFKYFVSVACP